MTKGSVARGTTTIKAPAEPAWQHSAKNRRMMLDALKAPFEGGARS
jgi:hypothetical protein